MRQKDQLIEGICHENRHGKEEELEKGYGLS
jgi:hypothetical protein